MGTEGDFAARSSFPRPPQHTQRTSKAKLYHPDVGMGFVSTKQTENVVGSPYGEVSILAGGILYLFAGLAYSRKKVTETVDQLSRMMSKAEPKLRSCLSENK